MKIEDVIGGGQVDFSGIDLSYFLIGLMSAFENRFQAEADRLIGEISWKQFFAIICINMCTKAPSIRELAEIMGSSHQNVKQILLKLEKKGFVSFCQDESDRRVQRIAITEKCMHFCEKNDETGTAIMQKMFHGIPEEALQTTIQTIIRMEANLKGE